MPWKYFVFLRITAAIKTDAIPITYINGATQPPFVPESFVARIAAIIAITGNFAPHGIHVVVKIVILRSFSFSIVRLAIMPGTPQPVPTRSGMKDFPERPNLRKSLSITNAMRTI